MSETKEKTVSMPASPREVAITLPNGDEDNVAESATPAVPEPTPPTSPSTASSSRHRRKQSSAAQIPLAPPPPPQEAQLTYESMKASVPFEELFNSEEFGKFKFQDLVTYPEDDVVRVSYPKIHRTGICSQIQKVQDLEPYVGVCLECFTADWILTKYNYKQYSRQKFETEVYDLPPVKYEVSDKSKASEMNVIGRLSTKKSGVAEIKKRSRSSSSMGSAQTETNVQLSQNDPHFVYARPITKRTLLKNKKERRANRLQFFQYYDPEYDWQPGTEVALCQRIRKTMSPDARSGASHFRPFYFHVQPQSIVFHLGNYEPFFARLFLVDIKSKCILSESYYFHTNEDILMTAVRQYELSMDQEVSVDTALFSVTRRNENVYLVLYIDKILQGDPEMSVDPYVKIKSMQKQKDQMKCQNKIRAEVDDYSIRLGKYRQPLGWSALQVFNKTGNLLLSSNATFESIYSRDFDSRESLFNLLLLMQQNAGNTKELKKLGKNLNGYCSINVSKVEETQLPKMRLIDSSLQKVRSPDIEDEAKPVMEIYEFPQIASMTPSFYYVNNMYIYPKSFQYSKGAKNITIRVQVKDDDMDLDAPGLKCIYSPTHRSGLVNEFYTSVHYHTKSPVFTEEVKILLPPHLSTKHHLLFTFFHVNTGKQKKGNEDVETPLGYTVVPLFPDKRIVVHNMDTHHAMPALPKLDQCYLGAWDQLTSELKPSFDMQFKLVSTVYPEDASITNFLNVYHTSEEEVSDIQLNETLEGLAHLSKELATQYLPVIINNLLEVMCTRKAHAPKLEAFKALVNVLSKVTEGSDMAQHGMALARNPMLELYSNYIFSQTFGTRRSVYHTLCSNLLLYLMEKKLHVDDDTNIVDNSWLILDLIIKSMVLEQEFKGTLNAKNRSGCFDDNFVRVLSKMLSIATKYYSSKLQSPKGVESVKVLNKNISLFIKDLLSIFDRGIVIDMIRQYLNDLNFDSNRKIAVDLKFEFIRIVMDHEHFLPLNLPVYAWDDLSLEAVSTHFPLCSILVFEVIETLKGADIRSCDVAISTLYDIIIKQAMNSKTQDEERRRVVSSIFFILLLLTVSQFHSIQMWVSQAPKASVREFYACIIYVLSTVDRNLLRAWWRRDSSRNHVIFLQLVSSIITAFNFDPKETRATKSLLTPQVALFMNSIGTPEMAEILKGLARQLNAEERASQEDKRLRQLTLEVHTSMLDLVEDFIEDFHSDLCDYSQKSPVMEQVIDVFLHLLDCTQSDRFVHILYASLRALAHRFREVLFLGENSYILSLMMRIVRHLNAREEDINNESSTFLFVLLKLNHRVCGHFGRTRIQTVTALSRLVSQDGGIKEDVGLSEAFSRLSKYAMYGYASLHIRDVDPTTLSLKDDEYASKVYAHFARSVQGLASALSAILNDTIRVNELKQKGDPESICDLYLQIADSYSNTPDLRLSWLRELAKFQDACQNYAEAGMCYASASALIADYLTSFSEMTCVDTALFHTISKDIREFADDAEDDAAQSSEFTEKRFMTDVQFAISFFKQDNYFEYASQMYKMLVPLYEKDHSYHNLSQAYINLHKCWNEVEMSNEDRLFGKYFRVGFYGEAFGELLNGREYVYKEPKLTHLLDISDRLKTHFSKFTQSEVELLDSTKGQKLDSLDPQKCFILITFIEPYLDPKERERNTYFECNAQLDEFVFETPFTKSGKAHADSPADQYKRKTVLTCSHHFPYLVKRLPVVKKRDIIITPLENAIEEIGKRNTLIENEIGKRPINPKTLQQVLQGSVRLQVNEGATAMTRIFLGDKAYINHPREQVEALVSACTNFVQLCKVALAQNAGNARTDTDRAFHVEMDIGFKQLEAEMNETLSQVYFDDLSESDSATVDDDSSIHDDSESISSPRLTARRSTVDLSSATPEEIKKITSATSLQIPGSPRRRTATLAGGDKAPSFTTVVNQSPRRPLTSSSDAVVSTSPSTPKRNPSPSPSAVAKQPSSKKIRPPAGPPPGGKGKKIQPPAGPPPSKLAQSHKTGSRNETPPRANSTLSTPATTGSPTRSLSNTLPPPMEVDVKSFGAAPPPPVDSPKGDAPGAAEVPSAAVVPPPAAVVPPPAAVVPPPAAVVAAAVAPPQALIPPPQSIPPPDAPVGTVLPSPPKINPKDIPPPENA